MTLRLKDLIVRYRRWLIGLSLLCFVVSFNGRWRIGLDSSIYRGLADAIASGRGYNFGEFGSHQIYPGLPFLLAALQRIFGEEVFRPVIPLLVMNAMAIATLLVVYRLLKQTCPMWMAVSATCGLATNARFVKLANELLTDVPFMLGMVMAMLGWSALLDSSAPENQVPQVKRPGTVASAMLLVFGLALACTMRPAFWFFAFAWMLVCLWGLVRGSVKLHAACLTALLATAAVFATIDPRNKGSWNPFAGGYEQEVLEVIASGVNGTAADADLHGWNLLARVRNQLPVLLDEHLPAALLGQELPGRAGTVFSLALIVAVTVFLVPRQPLWGLLILITLIGTTALSTPPRYYVVLVPFMLVAMLRLGVWLGSLLPHYLSDFIILPMMLMVTGMNIAKLLPFVAEQHSVPLTAPALSFYDTYRDGKFARMIRLADVVAQHVPDGAKVLAPNASVIAYLSKRDVMMERELIPARKSRKKYPEHIATVGLQYAVFPYKIYRDKEPIIKQFMEKGVIVASTRIASTDGMKLARARVIVPDHDWKDGTGTAATQPGKKLKKPTTQKVKKPTTKPKKKPTTRPKKKKKPTTTQIRRKKKKHAATGPSTAPATRPSAMLPPPERFRQIMLASYRETLRSDAGDRLQSAHVKISSPDGALVRALFRHQGHQL